MSSMRSLVTAVATAASSSSRSTASASRRARRASKHCTPASYYYSYPSSTARSATVLSSSSFSTSPSSSSSSSSSSCASQNRVLVVGSGVIGLRTAVELTRRNVPVVVRSPVPPLHHTNCSQGAGGLWMPFHCDDPRTHRWSIETLDEIYPMAMDGQDSLVKMEYAVSLKRHHHGPQTSDFVADDYDRGTGGNSKLPAWSTDPRLRFQNVSIEQVAWQNQVLKLRLPPLHLAQEAGYEHAWMFETPIIDSPKMLTSMLEEVRRQPNNVVDVETGVYYQSIDEILDEAQNLGCQAVVNATGLGAKAICNDDQLIGGRGVLLQFDRETCIRSKAAMQEELSTVPASEFMQPVEQTQDACVMIEDAPWGSDEFPCYMIVRGDTIVVGGSYLEGDTETSMRPAERERLLENARIMGIETSSMLQKPKSEWVGFRPYRPTTRVEKEEIQLNGGNNTIRVVHSYGTGGSGWTVYTGVAKDTVRLVLDEN